VLNSLPLRPHRQRFAVGYDYPVSFTHGLFDPENGALLEVLPPSPRPHRAFVLVDSGVAAAWPDLPAAISAYAAAHARWLELVAAPLIIDGGEDCKNDPDAVADLQRRFFELRLDRHAFVIPVGGGAMIDLVGYAAATTHRGVRVIRVPTTTLAQADAAVGVKCGVNAFGAKNFLGAFAPPWAVLVDGRFLHTQAPRDRAAGLAEAIKVALVRDRGFFDWIEAHAGALAAHEAGAVDTLVRRSALLHLHHIATGGDPFEQGSARPLDFGHWSAHKLESLSRHQLRHGEAVAIGMLLDAHYSVSAGLLDAAAFARIADLLERLRLPGWHPALGLRGAGGRRSVLDGLEEFREHLGGTLNVTMLAGIGCGREIYELRLDEVERAIAWAEERACRSQKMCI
jgi:3-dehydroquinate synthase